MNNNSTIWKVIAAVAAVGTAVFVGVAYGDKIVAWVKKVLKLDSRKSISFYEDDYCYDEECCDEGTDSVEVE